MASKPKRLGQNKRIHHEEKNDITPPPPIAAKRRRVLTRKLRDSSLDIVNPIVYNHVETTPVIPKREKKTRTPKLKTPVEADIGETPIKKVAKKVTKQKVKKITKNVQKNTKKVVKKKIDNKPIKYDKIVPLETINEVALMQSAKKGGKQYPFDKKSKVKIERPKKRVIKVKIPKGKRKTSHVENLEEIVENNFQQDGEDLSKNIIEVPVMETVNKNTKFKRKITPKKVKTVKKPKKAATKKKTEPIKAISDANCNTKTTRLRGRQNNLVSPEINCEAPEIHNSKVENEIFGQKYISRLSLSSVSLSDALSWTKEMSSTSISCSSVTINDIVKIDGKIPLVSVLRDDDIVQNTSLNLSSGTSSSCIDSVTTGDSSNSLFTSLGLTKSTEVRSIDKKLEENLNLIKSKVNSFDVEFVTWSMRDYEDKPICKEKLADIIVKTLKHELELLEKCEQMRPLIKSVINHKFDKRSSIQSSEKMSEDPTFDKHISKSPVIATPYIEKVVSAEPITESPVTNISNLITSQEPVIEKIITPKPNNDFLDSQNQNEATDTFVKPSPVINHKTSSNKDNTTHTLENRNEQTDIDDDCLSIYDSTDSFWINNCDISEPQPNVDQNSELISDMALSNSEDGESLTDSPQNEIVSELPDELLSDKSPIVCEKQNADTTFTDDKLPNQEQIENQDSEEINNSTSNCIKLVTPNFTTISLGTSNIFNGLCFNNLKGFCRKYVCHYVHKKPTEEEVAAKLQNLSDFSFIQEYVLITRHHKCLFKYLPVFIDDCLRRHLWDLLAEISIDVYKNSSQINMVFGRNILEKIVLGFKDCDLNTVKLLEYSLKEGYNVCDMFLQIIAKCPNFTQFKDIFIRLSEYFDNKKRSVSLDMVTPIVEKVCILAYSKQVVEATLKIVLNTQHSILKTQYMETFERLIDYSLLDSNLINKFKKFKEDHTNFEKTAPTINVEPKNFPRYTSPDTTHLDVTNKLETSLCAKMDTFNPFSSHKQLLILKPFESYNTPNSSQDNSLVFNRKFGGPNSSNYLERWNYGNRPRRGNYQNINRQPLNKKRFSPHPPTNYFKQ